MPLRIRRLVVIITAVLATTLGATSGVAVAGSELESLVEIEAASDDMGSTAVETSGATYNADRHVLLTIDDETNAYEYSLNADGTIDHATTPRILDLDLGRSDFEGVAWIAGDTYAFLSEEAGEVIVATIAAPAPRQRTTIGADDIVYSFPVITGNWGNLGPEGLATDGEAFYVARELPSTLTKFDLLGNYVASVDLTVLADATGVVALGDGTFLVTSHESRMIAHYDIDWDTEQATLLATRNADLFTQLEGIALMGSSDVYLFGEDNSRKGQTGQTFSHLNGVLVPIAYATSDVDCSGGLDIGDAMLVARMDVGLLQPIEGCGSGDHNGDGEVNLIDAIMIAQCDVGLYNVGCPAEIN